MKEGANEERHMGGRRGDRFGDGTDRTVSSSYVMILFH